jgi:hypothetical protein
VNVYPVFWQASKAADLFGASSRKKKEIINQASLAVPEIRKSKK